EISILTSNNKFQQIETVLDVGAGEWPKGLGSKIVELGLSCVAMYSEQRPTSEELASQFHQLLNPFSVLPSPIKNKNINRDCKYCLFHPITTKFLPCHRYLLCDGCA